MSESAIARPIAHLAANKPWFWSSSCWWSKVKALSRSRSICSSNLSAWGRWSSAWMPDDTHPSDGAGEVGQIDPGPKSLPTSFVPLEYVEHIGDGLALEELVLAGLLFPLGLVVLLKAIEVF